MAAPLSLCLSKEGAEKFIQARISYFKFLLDQCRLALPSEMHKDFENWQIRNLPKVEEEIKFEISEEYHTRKSISLVQSLHHYICEGAYRHLYAFNIEGARRIVSPMQEPDEGEIFVSFQRRLRCELQSLPDIGIKKIEKLAPLRKHSEWQFSLSNLLTIPTYLHKIHHKNLTQGNIQTLRAWAYRSIDHKEFLKNEKENQEIIHRMRTISFGSLPASYMMRP